MSHKKMSNAANSGVFILLSCCNYLNNSNLREVKRWQDFATPGSHQTNPGDTRKGMIGVAEGSSALDLKGAL